MCSIFLDNQGCRNYLSAGVTPFTPPPNFYRFILIGVNFSASTRHFYPVKFCTREGKMS